VEAEFALTKVFNPVLLDHDENVLLAEGVAEIESTPASFQRLVPEGEVVPEEDGLTANEIKY